MLMRADLDRSKRALLDRRYNHSSTCPAAGLASSIRDRVQQEHANKYESKHQAKYLCGFTLGHCGLTTWRVSALRRTCVRRSLVRQLDYEKTSVSIDECSMNALTHVNISGKETSLHATAQQSDSSLANKCLCRCGKRARLAENQSKNETAGRPRLGE